MEGNQHVVLDLPYQGDGIWIVFVVFSLFLFLRQLLAARRKRNAGQPVNVRALIAGCLISLGFCAVGIYQLWTHH